MRVLIAVDGSTGGFEAVLQAGQLLSPEKDQVALYYSTYGIHPGGSSAASPAVVERARSNFAAAVFSEAMTHLPAGFQGRVETIEGTQSPKTGIIAAATQWKADMIFVGARGLGPMQKLLLGSVSRSTVHSAEIPVYVARPRWHEQTSGLRALLACENRERCQAVCTWVKALTWPAGALGYMITVAPSMFAGQVPSWLQDQARSTEVEQMSRAWVEEHDAELAASRTMLEDIAKTLPEPFQKTSPIVVEGHPGDKIVEAVHQEKIDLVVVGASHAGAVARLLLGSTSEAVLSHAPCSVLVVRIHAHP